MYCHRLMRGFHSAYPLWNSSKKALLAELRKKTGYTFANCKKALELSEYNIQQAEKWLADQAQALGWSKAIKMEGRTTAQGLVGVAVENNAAALVEVNCETDFVARNEIFHRTVESAASACLQYTKTQNLGRSLSRFDLSADDLKVLPGDSGKSLAEHLALAIGTVGENLALRRAACFLTSPDTLVSGYVHPAPPMPSGVLLGKFGAIMAFRADKPGENVEEVGRQLCQHIVGMNPMKIGIPDVDTPNSNPDEEQCLIHQEFLLDPSQTVGQRLTETGISIVDFIRFECGEKFDLHVHASDIQPAAAKAGA